MYPSEIRKTVLDQHASLRVLLAEADQLAGRITERGATQELRQVLERLLGQFELHMAFEEGVVAPALQDADAWGPERVAQLRDEHARQRHLIEQARSSLFGRAEDVPGLVNALCSWMREDMEDEERTMLDPDLLRDDLVTIGQCAG